MWHTVRLVAGDNYLDERRKVKQRLQFIFAQKIKICLNSEEGKKLQVASDCQNVPMIRILHFGHFPEASTCNLRVVIDHGKLYTDQIPIKPKLLLVRVKET
ncbi:hypothetical protein RRG08_052773 [Elysia crispata]|uniref:Uncharacterized protein n=1 Tax=Elysia crispata TaxID=231223 RepID=A0AAE1B6D7_9GAST|nr:hypothetical protein RRG08_052773 [Elysia crispata]